MSVQANPQVHPEAQAYIDLIAATHRPLFDRLHALILASHPNVTVGLSYKMPVYVLGNGRLHVGVWSHGLSLYGWPQGFDPSSAGDLWLVRSNSNITLRSTQ